LDRAGWDDVQGGADSLREVEGPRSGSTRQPPGDPRGSSSLEDAIVDITNQSADWQQILDETLANLPGEAKSFVRVELSSIVQRSISAAGSEVRCVVDFLHTRVVEDLRYLLTVVSHRPPPLRTAVVCGVSPSLIRMSERNADPSRFEAVEIFGYNFDRGEVALLLLTENSVVHDVTHTNGVSNVTVQHHHQMMINLGANGVKLTPTSQLLALVWDSNRLSEIPIIQPEPSPCRIRRQNLDTIGSHEVRAQLLAGDREFGTNQPLVSAGVTLTNSESHVDAKHWIRAEANGGDTVGFGSETFSIHSADRGWRVLRIVTPAVDEVGALPRHHLGGGPVPAGRRQAGRPLPHLGRHSRLGCGTRSRRWHSSRHRLPAGGHRGDRDG
jgi:hypothetical protein